MKRYPLWCLALIVAGAIIAGCTGTDNQTQSLPAAATTIPSDSPATNGSAVVSTTQTFALGDHYIQKSYSFHNTNDKYTEQVRIDNQSWALVYKVTPLSDDTATGWFEVTITNVDSKKSQTYGYGGTYAYDTYQQYPMYGAGSYQVALAGNLTKVDLDVAKRLPG